MCIYSKGFMQLIKTEKVEYFYGGLYDRNRITDTSYR